MTEEPSEWSAWWCGENRATLRGGAMTRSDCVCDAGFFLSPLEECETCAPGGRYYKEEAGNARSFSGVCPKGSSVPGKLVGPKSPDECVRKAAVSSLMNLIVDGDPPFS